MSVKPTISVIIPTCNRPRTLWRAVKSALGQTCAAKGDRLEVLVVDDGEQDPAPVLASLTGPAGQAELAGRELRLLRTGGRKGPAAARNLGIAHARGEYLAYLDDDDFLSPEHFERLLSALRTTGLRLAYSGAYVLREERDETGGDAPARPGRKRMVMSNPYDPLDLQARNLFPIHAALHCRSLVDEVGGFDETLPAYEDYDLWLRFQRRTDFAALPEPTCWYVKGAGKKNLPNNLSDDDRRMHESLVRVYAKHPVSDWAAEQVADISSRRSQALAAWERKILQAALAAEITALRKAYDLFPADSRLPFARWSLQRHGDHGRGRD